MQNARRAHAMPGLVHGVCQSPVNIITKDAASGQHRVAIQWKTGAEQIANLGHTVQISRPDGGSVDVDGARYDFAQFHFHTPSEHLIDGEAAALEMHIVHTRHDDPQAYLVIGVLFREGDSSPFIDSFLNAVPAHDGETIVRNAGTVELRDVAESTTPFFHYRGSLTTPPYSETVQWLVRRTTLDASAAQVAALMALEGQNARMVQALHGRPID